MVIGESNNPLEGTFSADHLKIVEIKCGKVDERIHKILKVLSTCGISTVKVSIRQTNTSSGSGCEWKYWKLSMLLLFIIFVSVCFTYKPKQ